MKISLITAVYNREREIASALASIAEQSWPHVEYIVVDGASTDGTRAVVESGPVAVDHLISEPDKGIYDALNKGVSRATGDVIGFLHSDDIFAHSAVLERVAQAFDHPHVEAVYGDLEYVAKDDLTKVIRRWRAGHFEKRRLHQGWMPPHPTLFLKRSVYERVGAFDLSYRIAADYDFILRAFAPGIHAAYIPEVLVKMRVGGVSNSSLKRIALKSREDWRAARRAGLVPATTVMAKNLSKVPQFLRRGRSQTAS